MKQKSSKMLRTTQVTILLLLGFKLGQWFVRNIILCQKLTYSVDKK